MKSPLFSSFAASAIFLGLATVPPTARAGTSTFTGAVSNDYETSGNWSTGSVPNTAGGDTAVIGNGSAVSYDPTAGAGDYILANGGTLQVTNGSWTQTAGIAWIQIGQGGGNGHLLVDGGNFDQGTASNFNVSGTGNTVTVSSGTANFTTQVNGGSGISWTVAGGTMLATAGQLTVQSGGSFSVTGGSLVLGGNLILQDGSSWSQSGGTVTLGAASEFQFNSLSGSSMSGGVLNVPKLLTGVNGAVGSTFDFSGGVINDGGEAFNGWYGADNAAHPFNFTLGSTGVINFLDGNTTMAQVDAWLAAGGIQYNNTIDPGAFLVSQDGTTVSLQLAVPEPPVNALLFGGMGMALFLYRRVRRA